MAERNENSGDRRGKRAGASASDTMDAAKDAARDTFEQAKAQAGAAGEAATHEVRRLGEQMREAAQSLLHEQQERLAEAVHGLAEALRRTADTLERENNDTVAHYAEQAADQIDRLSETVRRRDFREVLESTQDFARRQPALFIAGAVAAGFVIGRLLSRPSSEGRSQGYATSAAGGGYHPAYQTRDEPMAGYGPAVGGGRV
ncbi:MAG TPA: hypothetical protein VF502_04215 [Stellaceae bacterium]